MNPQGGEANTSEQHGSKAQCNESPHLLKGTVYVVDEKGKVFGGFHSLMATPQKEDVKAKERATPPEGPL